MNIFFRISLTIYAFFLTILSFISIMASFKPQIIGNVYEYLSDLLAKNTSAPLIMFVISLIFFSLSITFLLSGFKPNKDRRAISKHTNIGEVRISLDSIESIALAASRRLSGIKETKAYVSNSDDNVSVTIKAIVLPDINIPALTEDIQVKVKSSVEECAGIKVSDVRVLVENIYTGYKTRVE